MKKTLSKKYGILKIFQILIGLSIFLYTIIFFKSLIDLSKMTDDNTLLIQPTVAYLGFLFSSFCVIIIVEFLFKLDDTKNNFEGIRTSYYENGQKKLEQTYKDGELNGKQTEWYENGQKRWEATYKDGKLIYKDGKLISSKYWDKDGNLKE